MLYRTPTILGIRDGRWGGGIAVVRGRDPKDI